MIKDETFFPFTKEDLKLIKKCIGLTEIEYGENDSLSNMNAKINNFIENYDMPPTVQQLIEEYERDK
jgi:hypothetical protein